MTPEAQQLTEEIYQLEQKLMALKNEAYERQKMLEDNSSSTSTGRVSKDGTVTLDIKQHREVISPDEKLIIPIIVILYIPIFFAPAVFCKGSFTGWMLSFATFPALMVIAYLFSKEKPTTKEA